MSAPPLFRTQEIGSLAKPRWQLQGQHGRPIDARAREELDRWNARLAFAEGAGPQAERWLAGAPDGAADEAVRDLGALFALRFFEKVGLDRVYDGEARRIEMYEYPIRQMGGFEFLGHVRSFDNKYYRKAAATGPVRLERPYHLEEFDFVRSHARGLPKIPVTGAYTLAEWSYDEHYLARQAGWKGRQARRTARAEFVIDIARQALRPTLRALVDRGARLIQIDEPAAGTHPDEADLVAEGFNAATEGLDAEFSMHICFSDYRSLFPAILGAKRCRQWAWEFANRDTARHDGYEILKLFREYGDDREIGLGVLDVHRDEVETPALVADRIERAAKHLGDPARIWVNPDCGLRTRSLDVAWQKLGAMVEGAKTARAKLEGRAG